MRHRSHTNNNGSSSSNICHSPGGIAAGTTTGPASSSDRQDDDMLTRLMLLGDFSSDEEEDNYDDYDAGEDEKKRDEHTPSLLENGQGGGSPRSRSSLFRKKPHAPSSVPGRPRRRNPMAAVATGILDNRTTAKATSPFRRRRRRRSGNGDRDRVCGDRGVCGVCAGLARRARVSSSLILAVALWYTLGVVSISTSKVLLTPAPPPLAAVPPPGPHYNQHNHNQHYNYYRHVGGVPPLLLTVQQLLLGSTFLRLLLHFKFLSSPGLRSLESLLPPPPIQGKAGYGVGSGHGISSSNPLVRLLQCVMTTTGTSQQHHHHATAASAIATSLRHLLFAGMAFSFGFYTTNLAFGSASPTYVETLKAAEPITSALLAVTWGIESLTSLEVASLGGIVTGVLLSTLGGGGGGGGATAATLATSTTAAEALWHSVVSGATVMASNLCFSFRGLYQKLFRLSASAAAAKAAAPSVSTTTTTTTTTTTGAAAGTATAAARSPHLVLLQLDDLNLQYRMQQTGVLLFLIPALIWEGPAVVRHWYHLTHSSLDDIVTPAETAYVFAQYLAWSVANGLAFSAYNLASTFLLTRISVVHHAALNCTRRIFAIVCTSILFGIPISYTSAVGIAISFFAFMVFTYAKTSKTTGAVAAGTNRGPDGSSSSLLPTTSTTTVPPLPAATAGTAPAESALYPPPTGHHHNGHGVQLLVHRSTAHR